MINVKGFVSHIVYRNEENGYTVFEVTCTEPPREDSAQGDESASGGKDTSGDDSGPGDELTCVGYPVSISEGEGCAVTGEYATHPVYGDQLKVSSYRAVAPENAQAMYRYLAAGSIRGIGRVLAARIVKKFGDDTMRVMEEEPEKLAQIKGISMRIARDIGAQMEDRKDLRDAMIFLQQYGIGHAHAARIWKTYGIELYTVLKTNPYRLAEDIRGIGFGTADEIARRIGIQADSEYRIRSGIIYVLSLAAGEGHSYLPRDLLVQRTGSLLRLPSEEILVQMENLAIERRIRLRRVPAKEHMTADISAMDSVYGPGEGLQRENSRGPDNKPSSGSFFESGTAFSEEGFLWDQGAQSPGAEDRVEVYLAGAYRKEQEIAKMLLDLDAQIRGRTARKEDREKMDARIRALEKEEGLELDPLQRRAVREAADNAVLVMSGGPGTGKTTTINTIIRFFIEEGNRVLLAAPTGRAARRMTEATGYAAMTIHRLLGVRSAAEDDDGFASEDGAGRDRDGRWSWFEKDEESPLEADVIVIDEMSMVDMHLFHALLRAVPPGAHLILVGDVNQLPSVGPGCVLQDLIESHAFHTIMLRHVFRQASESDIVMNAHRVLEGRTLPMDNKSRDFFFLERDQPPVIYKHIVQLIRQMLPKYAACRPEEIQVLTPMRRGSLGVERLNEALQSVLNPPAERKREHTYREIVFREGDKVMQTRNNYQLEWEIRGNFGMPMERGTGIFNGDFGTIREIDRQREMMTILFDDARTVEYPFSELEDLDLAYAITVHKSQGSEYPVVLLPILAGPSGLLNRNLLYTAITRARKCVVILGSRAAVDKMIANTRRARRYTGLRDRILEADTSERQSF